MHDLALLANMTVLWGIVREILQGTLKHFQFKFFCVVHPKGSNVWSNQTLWQARKGTSIWRLYGSAPVLLQSTTGSNLQASPASNRMSMWPRQCRTNSLWRSTSWIKHTRREGSSWNGKGRKGKWRERKEREGKKRKGKERRWGETTATHLRKCMNKHGDTKWRDTQSGWAG